MNCYTHQRVTAVGMCGVCQRGVCGDCVAADSPRLVCRNCANRGTVGSGFGLGYGYGFGYEYKSSIAIGSWPLVHIAGGWDPVTMRPRIARGVIAIGNIAIGGLAVGGLAVGLVTLGGASIGALMAIGGAALGLGLSLGGFAVGSIAIGGVAVGFTYAIGGSAIGPAVVDATHCDEMVVDFARRWLNASLPACR